MTPARLQQLESLFDQARRLPTGERATFVAGACPEDAALHQELLDLLAADDLSEAPLDRPPLAAAAASAALAATAAPAPPSRIGAYRILRLLGEGGMGLVYEAEQDNPRRRVALKLLRPGLGTPAAIRRFEHEAQLLGRLRSPGIAQIYEAGTGLIEVNGTAVRQPFLAMELVDGLPITQFADQHAPELRRRVALIADVCDAVHHAHQRGIIHRDLKPENILVVAEGSEGHSDPQPKVLDFGIARVLDGELKPATAHTAQGQMIGTLPYMSPEQVSGETTDLDVRTDVYSLGVVLYEMICGRTPHASDSAVELVRRISTANPLRPSAVNRGARGDLETIVLKALEKDRTRRYSSMAEFGHDLRRCLAGEPIAARRASAFYILRKVVARHRFASSLLLAVLLTIAASTAALAFLYRRAENARIAADERAAALRRSNYFNTIALAQSALERFNTLALHELLAACPTDLRGWEWRYLQRQADNSQRAFPVHADVAFAAFLPDGECIVTFGFDRALRVWDALSAVPLGTMNTGAMLEAGAVFPDGRRVAIVGRDGDVQIWDALGCERLFRWSAHDGWATAVACAPNGRTLATGGHDEVIRIWDTETGAQLDTLVGHTSTVSTLEYSPDGQLLASGGSDRRVLLWDARARALLLQELTAHRDDVCDLAFTPDGGALVSSGADGRVFVWNLVTGEPQRNFDCGDDAAGRIAISPDGQRVAVSAHFAVRTWNLTTGDEETPRLGGHNRIGNPAFSPDGAQLIATNGDGKLYTWSGAPQEEPRTLREHRDVVRSVAVTPDGGAIVSGSRDGTVRVWDVRTGVPRWRLRGPVDWLGGVACSQDGQRVFSAGFDGRLRVWDAQRGVALGEFPTQHPAIRGVALSRDGRRLALGVGKQVELRDAADPANVLGVLAAPHDVVYALAFAPDGTQLVSAARDGRVWLSDVASAQTRRALSGHAGQLLAVAWSPDGEWIAGGGSEQTVYLWDGHTGELRHALRGHRGLVQSLAFSPDSSRLASGCYGRLIHLWEPRTGQLALTLRGHEGGINGLAFDPLGRFLVSSSTDATVRIWKADD